MKLKKATVFLFSLAGVLFLVGGLRDAFAPGFFNVSSAAPGRLDIILKFVSAFAFLALAASTAMSQRQDKNTKS
ncbi:MAG TPA: hypothetical protein VLL54_16185 [Pyrinomonadaceae bacterium]|nr:hypothetical protein [Pyrinomonadaceae bacterium]